MEEKNPFLKEKVKAIEVRPKKSISQLLSEMKDTGFQAIQITTDSPQWGGLSGCTFEEAISWGKEDVDSKFVQCYCDATIALPIVAHALAERVKERKIYPDFSWLFKGLE
jgi:deoxyhypusine synthase